MTHNTLTLLLPPTSTLNWRDSDDDRSNACGAMCNGIWRRRIDAVMLSEGRGDIMKDVLLPSRSTHDKETQRQEQCLSLKMNRDHRNS